MTTNISNRTIYSPVQKDSATFVETVAETNGKHTLIDVELAPGGGTGLHYHTEHTELFEVLEGTLGIELNGVQYSFKPGETATAPINSLHRFYNASSAPVRFRATITPGHRGFEQTLMISYGLARDGKINSKGLPANPLIIGMLVEMSASHFGGKLKWAEPLFSAMAAVARWTGLERRLIKRYVTI